MPTEYGGYYDIITLGNSGGYVIMEFFTTWIKSVGERLLNSQKSFSVVCYREDMPAN
jgi:hypothetical protein